MKIRGIQFVTTKTSVGKGANDGIYPPGGLLTIAADLHSAFGENLKIWIDDQHHSTIEIRDEADIVGIQVASTLTYKTALEIAERARLSGKVVVLGGHHATTLPDQILRNRLFLNFVIRGKGERSMIQFVEALEGTRSLQNVESLSWRDQNRIVHNDFGQVNWKYDDYVPLPLQLLSSGVSEYWRCFRSALNRPDHAAFLLFTHFGCGYRQRRIEAMIRGGLPVYGSEEKTSFCSYCSLDDIPLVRDSHSILGEIKYYLQTYCQKGWRVHLKCYGDNIGPQHRLIRSLRTSIESCDWWRDYHITWTFYCQSSYLTEKLARDLGAIGTTHLYIGFDSADNELQRRNGLGTSRATHERAVRLCLKYGMKIQAGSVVGLLGETPETLASNLDFNKWLASTGAIERINSAVLFLIPGTPAFNLLAAKEPHLRELDLFSTNEVRELWVKHFCPAVTQEMLQNYADQIDSISPGVHASMGFDSSLLKTNR